MLNAPGKPCRSAEKGINSEAVGLGLTNQLGIRVSYLKPAASTRNCDQFEVSKDSEKPGLVLPNRYGLKPRANVVELVAIPLDSCSVKCTNRKGIVHSIQGSLASMCNMISKRNDCVND